MSARSIVSIGRARGVAVVAAIGILALGVASSAHAFQVCAKEDKNNPGHPKEKSKLYLKVACDPAKKEVSVGLEVTGIVGTDAVVRVAGANLQVVSGSGTTNGPVNGLGNVLVGYDEGRCTYSDGFSDERECTSIADCFPNTCVSNQCTASYGSCATTANCPVNTCLVTKSGSHNLVVGPGHGYFSTGGAVLGAYNVVGSPHSTVTGGWFNTAQDGDAASVSGGSGNYAEGGASSISGGAGNVALGYASAVSGGSGNHATGNYTGVSGGSGNTASAEWASVSGGTQNLASTFAASVTGGRCNVAGPGPAAPLCADTSSGFGAAPTVSGGSRNQATGAQTWVGGGICNLAGSGSISGCVEFFATGQAVSGGTRNRATGNASSVSGGDTNLASGSWSAVSGGDENVAGANHASVSGGTHASVTGAGSAISGGDFVSVSAANAWKAGSVGAPLGPHRFFSE